MIPKPAVCTALVLGVSASFLATRAAIAADAPFRAGAAVVDVTPTSLPVLVNGNFLQAKADTVRDRLAARALVLDDGTTRLAIVVVDSCMMPRELLDAAKALAWKRTGIPVDRMLVSATHTHSAPAAMGALGCDADPAYVAFLPGRIAEAIESAARALESAKIGWVVVDDYEHTHCRRWIRRPDKVLVDPFGQKTARANMHPGYQSPDVIGPSGPVDPGLSVLSVQASDGRPIAVLANYSMHYFGAEPLSADYYGRFASALARKVGGGTADARFVAIMSQGTSGDQHWMDYSRPKSNITIEAYAEAVASVAYNAYKSVTYRDRITLAMAETTLSLRRRVPDGARLAWARPILEKLGGQPPRNLPEVYAREAVFLHEQPERELKMQAIRIGDLGIAAIPDEVYALTGLKIKAHSPLATTFTIELANGSEGYIPPPEQHLLGGYTTWPARTAALEVQAEPKIVEAVLGLLEKVAGQPRREPLEAHGPSAKRILAAKPVAYWRLNEMQGTALRDASSFQAAARYEGGVALYLEGVPSPALSSEGTLNRAPHLAGGHIEARVENLGGNHTVELWFWQALPGAADLVVGDDVRLSLIPGGLEIATDEARGSASKGRELKGWHHLALTHSAGDRAAAYLDGVLWLSVRPPVRPGGDVLFLFGGGREGGHGLEGKLDEIAVFDRVLTADEIAAHSK
jgi:hypothetical protein